MPSRFGWVDFDEQDRQRMLNAVQLFREQDTRDELGIGTIRDAFSDYFFPGTSTIQTRARYMLFVPWIYRDLECKKVPSARIAERARQNEIRLIYALLESDDTRGVIGIEAKKNLQRLPSNIYWSGLWSWGIRQFVGSQDQYHRSLDVFYRREKNRIVSDDKEMVAGGVSENWDPGIPPSPDGMLEHAVLTLKKEEAQYLQDRILNRHNGSVMAKLVVNNRFSDVDFLWQHPIIASLPDSMLTNIIHARNFSETIHGAALLYNLMLAQAKENEELTERYIEAIDEWGERISFLRRELTIWHKNLKVFWLSNPLKTARIPHLTSSFVEEWFRAMFNIKHPSDITHNKHTRRLIHDREIQLKRGRARLKNLRALEIWGGASGDSQLDFRWHIANRILSDIVEGLENTDGEYA